MRLHRLEVTAFGPFADTVEVDFAALSEAGLFLLTGPTGAGKSSVLDAVCFALYGDVPGDRSAARRFRCDHAGPGVRPRVVLELSVAGRRLRCTRTPAWQRPKKRGSGLTTEQASVLVEERLGDAWVALSSRMDEAGHLMADLLGMNLPQFCQVAMLPQGRFQAFLRARSEERHSLLQQLFRTQRFEDVERWLRERSRELHRDSTSHGRGVAGLAARLLEVAGAELPDPWTVDDLAEPAASGELTGWSGLLVATAGDRATQAADSLADAVTAHAASSEALEAARALEERQRRHASAVSESRTLSAAGDAHDRRRAELLAARSAAPVPPLHRLAEAARARLDQAVARRDAADASAARALGLEDPDHLDDARLAAAEEAAADRLGAARALLPREHALADLQAAIDADLARAEELDGTAGRHAARLGDLPRIRDEDAAALAAARAASTRCQQLEESLADLDECLAAHTELDATRLALARAATLLADATGRCHELRERWLDLREARIQGMAAELASGLAVGACCPVCGSAEHPAKALAADGHPSPTAEKDARVLLDDAEAERTARTAQHHELGTRVAVLARTAGDRTADQLRAARDETERDRARCAEAAAGHEHLADRLHALDRETEELRQELERLRIEGSAVRARATERCVERDRLRAAIDTLLGDDDTSLAELSRRQQQCVDLLQAARAARRDAAACAEAHDDAAAAVRRALEEAGFADVDRALAAARPEEAVEALEEAVRDHERRLRTVSDLLDDPALAAAAELPEPDLGALSQAHDRAAAVLSDRRSRHDRAAVVLSRTRELHTELSRACAAWAPVLRSHEVAAGLAALTAGTSADNAWRMRLSAYVLAWRLGQVVAAANERLVAMTDQRYTLEQTGRRGAGESRGGLSLVVRDEWSGEARDPATLSGGETFVVSLALALGLADVVTGEAGGVELDTLFVDEGFGALDDETLDDVMNTLDGLRDGGRVVGVVSHVAEMRSRIPVRLRVTKQRTGSGVLVERDQP